MAKGTAYTMQKTHGPRPAHRTPTAETGSARYRIPRVLGLLILALLPVTNASANSQPPLWELGIGSYLVSLPAYRGAVVYQTYLLPLPYLVYRGRFLRSGRQGVSGIFLDRPNIELNLSAEISPPVNGKDVPIRAGMPNLEPSFGIGPQLKLHLYRSQQAILDFRVSLRAVQTFSLKPIGWYAASYLNLELPNWHDTGWNLGLAAGPNFADRGYHRYFYDVAPQYVTADRPTYRASGGYSGSSLFLAANRRLGKLWIGSFIRYDSLQGAVFENSPLVQTRQYLSAGIGFAWIFAESAQRAPQ